MRLRRGRLVPLLPNREDRQTDDKTAGEKIVSMHVPMAAIHFDGPHCKLPDYIGINGKR